VRARINGEVVELDRPPALDLSRKHTTDMVVNRFKVRDDLGLRLAESFETALRLGEGVARGSTAGEWWRREPRPRSWPIPTR
jgi:excinuclease ABC subunit A